MGIKKHIYIGGIGSAVGLGNAWRFPDWLQSTAEEHSCLYI
jgi:hypothetical protein